MNNIRRIGTVKSNFSEPTDPYEMRRHESTIIVDPEYQEGLYRIEEHQYIDVIFNFHLSDEYRLKGPIYSGEIKGVFASRSPKRPSAIGVTTVKLLERHGRKLRVTGLDAVDGTPVFDLKPSTSTKDPVEQQKLEHHRKLRNPRWDIIRHIRNREVKELLLKAGAIHGHFCPGLALGILAGTEAMRRMMAYALSDGMEDLLAIVETNNCFTDGIQYVTGCSFGNNALIYRDFGKTAFTLSKRDGVGIRFVVRPNYDENIDQTSSEFEEAFEKVIQNRMNKQQEKARFKKLAQRQSIALLSCDIEKIFKIEEVKIDIPAYAPIKESVTCSTCGEQVMNTKIIQIKDSVLCIPCADEKFAELSGEGIICPESSSKGV